MGLFSKKKTIPATGFYALPQNLQNIYSGVYNNAFNRLATNYDYLTPLSTTNDEARAFEMYRQGFSPTQESISNDISMLSNPFDSYVIDELNRQARGENSLVTQAATRAGQIGSNRSFLGTSDVEQNRLNNIGTFRQSNYNNALNAALTTLPALRQNDAANLMAIGDFQREQDMASKMAPFETLNTARSMLGYDPSALGTKAYTVKTGTGLGKLVGAVAPMIGSAFGPVGSVIGGALGGFASSGGNLMGALQGGLGGGIGAGFGSGMGSGFSLGQNLGALGSTSPVGPYKSFF